MISRIRIFSLCAFAVMASSASTAAQSNLTAKANGFQPQPARAAVESDRVRDGLLGPVRRVRTEIVKLSSEGGKLSEGKRSLLEIASYDIKGNKIENQYFPLTGGSLTGKEVYKYDEKGNISEMTLVNNDGSLLSKEVYKYEFDFAGNWNKMTTSVAVIEAGKMSFEATEVTYRSIMYYLDENMIKMAQPVAQPTSPPSVPPVNIGRTNSEEKPAPTPNNTSEANQKIAPPLPASMISANKLENLRSAEIKNVSASSGTQVPVVQLDTEPPPSPAPRPILKPASGGVLNGSALSLPAPIYPEIARRWKLSGVVVVEVVVDETGKVISAQVTDGPATLRDAALHAALRARFSPTKLSGQPVRVTGIINYKFSLAP